MGFIIYSTGYSKDILDRGAFQRRTTSDIEKTIPVFETSFPVTFGNVQRNRLCYPKPLVASMTMKATEILRERKRGSDTIEIERR